MRTVAALYIDPRGPYPRMPAVDCWDVSRDANQYDGFDPVVAHPPCGPWSKLRHLYKGSEHECAIEAVGFVRRNGGVLEHPANSRLWPACELPPPDGGHDEFGGYTVAVNQVSWGHKCAKPTWLYMVRVPGELMRAGIRTGGTPTHCVCTGPRQLQRLPVASKPIKRRTPPAFAEWLVSLARAVRP